ncbi:MAG: DUF4845 domain-containing protein [Burkholderiales bacterium]
MRMAGGKMRNRQSGLGLGGLIFGSVVLIFVVLLGLKVGPKYMEYFTIKEAITAIANSGETSPAEIRKSFDLRQAIDNMPSIKPTDLIISRDSGQVVISFAYRKEIPLFANVGLYIDFQASSSGS